MQTNYENENDYGLWVIRKWGLSDICISRLGLATVVT